MACIGTMIVNHVVQINSSTPSTYSNIFYRIALLIFNLKVESGFLEVAFQIFLFLCLTVQTSGHLSAQAYLQAYQQRYRQTIDANQHTRELILQCMRNSISAVQLGSEQLKLGESYDSNLQIPRLSSSLISSIPIPYIQPSNISSHVKNIAQLVGCMDLLTRHQFLDMDSECTIETETARRRDKLTPTILNNEQLYSFNVLNYMKNILQMYREIVFQNRKTISLFLLESKHKVPVNMLLNREAVGAILSNILASTISTSRKNNISIFISWLPKKQAAYQFPLLEKGVIHVEPIFVIQHNSTDSSNSSIGQQIERNLAKFSQGFPRDKNVNGSRDTSEWPQTQTVIAFPQNWKELVQRSNGSDFDPILHNSQLQPFSSMRQRQSEDFAGVGMLGSSQQMSSIKGGSQQPNYLSSMSSFSEQLSMQISHFVQTSKLQAGRVNSQQFAQEEVNNLPIKVLRRHDNSSQSQSLLGSAGRRNQTTSNQSLEKLLRKIDDLESQKRKESDPKVMQSNFSGLLSLPLPAQNRESMSCASSVLDQQLQKQYLDYPKEKWYHNQKNQNGHDLSRVSEYSKEENIKSSASNKNQPDFNGSSDKMILSVRGSIDNEIIVPSEGKWSVRANVYSSQESKILQEVSKSNLRLDLVKKSPISKQLSQQDMNHSKLLDDGFDEEEKVPNKQSSKKNLLPLDQIKIQPQQKMESVKVEELEDLDLEMEIPDEDCEVPLNHNFLGDDNATEKMREGKSYSGQTIVKYIFLDEKEREEENKNQSEQDPSTLMQQLQPQVQSSFNQIQNPIFEEEEKAKSNLSGQVKKDKQKGNMGSVGETPDVISQSSEGSRRNFMYNPFGAINQVLAEQPADPSANQNLQVPGPEQSPQHQKKSQFSVKQNTLEEIQEVILEVSSYKNEQSICSQQSAADSQLSPQSEINGDQLNKIMSSLDRLRLSENKKDIQKNSQEEAKQVQEKTPIQTKNEQKQLFSTFELDIRRQPQSNKEVPRSPQLEKFQPKNVQVSQFEEKKAQPNMMDHAQMIHKLQQAMKQQLEHTKQQLIEKNSLTPEKVPEPKVIEVRTLKRGRSKSIVVPGIKQEARSSTQRISRLNNYNPSLKKHRGSISIGSDLDSIQEEQSSQKVANDTVKESDSDKARYAKIFKNQGSQQSKGNGHLSSSFFASDKGASFSNYKFGMIQDSQQSKDDSSGQKQQSEIQKSLNQSSQSITSQQLNEYQIKEEAENVDRQRSNSVIKSIFVDNYGHGRRSNLKKKANQICRLNRSRSVVSSQIDQDRLKNVLKMEKLTLGDQLVQSKAQQANDSSKFESSIDSGLSAIEAQVQEYNGQNARSPAVQAMLNDMHMIKNHFEKNSDSNISEQSNLVFESSGSAMEDQKMKQSSQNSQDNHNQQNDQSNQSQGDQHQIDGQTIHNPCISNCFSQVLFEQQQEAVPLVKKKSTMLNVCKAIPQPAQILLQFGSDGNSSSSIINNNLQQKNSGRASVSLKVREEKFDNHYQKLMSQVQNQDQTSQQAIEIAQILQGWGKQTFMPQPEGGEIFDGTLQIQIFDLPPCKNQFKANKSQNIADVAATLSAQLQCGDTDCNRWVASKLLQDNMKPPKWTDIQKYDLKRNQLTPELELCRQLADLIGVEILMQPQKDSLGSQFCIRIPVASVPSQDN